MNKPPYHILNGDYFLTDGGLETTLIFHYGIDLPHFAAFDLLTHPEGRKDLKRYYTTYLDLARKNRLNFLLDTPTWRANTDWGFRMGYTQKDLDGINRKAVRLMKNLRSEYEGNTGRILINGEIGPRSDGYSPELIMSSSEAEKYHYPQIRVFAEEKADLATALTLTYSDEAIGIAMAAKDAGLPVILSFTLETDGALPNGESLKDAIQRTDDLSDGYAMHFMINCAHPSHFKHILKDDGTWKKRIGGVRANASEKSHAELDESETLDRGNLSVLAGGYADLHKLIPDLRIIGGCCGTDQNHIGKICDRVFSEKLYQ